LLSPLENFDEGDYYYVVLDLVVGGEMFDALCADGAYSEADVSELDFQQWDYPVFQIVLTNWSYSPDFVCL
jgi:hypothetical protein